jgi:hypothetical protein
MYTKRTLLMFSALMIMLASCSNKSNRNKLTVLSPFNASPADSAYAALRPTVQSFTVDNSRTNTLKAANGTEIFLPVGCFVQANGKPVMGNVQVEMVEVAALSDFISAGLATVAGDKMLMSRGMLYINAKAGGEQLQIDSTSPLRVSMPLMQGGGGYQMFTADSTGWQVDSTMLKADYAIPLPLNLLYPEGNKFFYKCITGLGDRDERYHYMDTNIVSVTNPMYENTLIATTEFKWRSDWLRAMTDQMSYLINGDKVLASDQCENQVFNYDLFKVYYENPTKTFRELDSVVKQKYLAYYAANKDKLLAYFDAINVKARKYFYQWTDTNYYYDFRKQSFEEIYMNPVRDFPPKSTREMRLVNNHGVDLNAPDAYEQLKAKGITTSEINQLLDYQFHKRALIKIWQGIRHQQVNQKKLSKFYESTIFTVGKLGWINCDIFYDDPTAGKADIYVSNKSNVQLDYMDCSLVIPELNVRLSGHLDKPGTYTFTQPGGRYIKLPIGVKAVIVGLACQHDSLFFASEKITIKDGLTVDLSMAPLSKNGLKVALEGILK